MSAAYDLQIAIYNALNGNISAPVYDHAPQANNPTENNADFPYVIIGEDNFTDWSTDDKDGFEATITIDVWSRYRGKTEVKQIQGEIYAILQRNELTIGQFGTLELSFDYEDCFQDSDARTYHGVQRFICYFAEPNEFELGQC